MKKARFKLKWKGGKPDFKKVPVDLISYSAEESVEHDTVVTVLCWTESDDSEIEDLKNYVEFVGYVD